MQLAAPGVASPSKKFVALDSCTLCSNSHPRTMAVNAGDLFRISPVASNRGFAMPQGFKK